MMSKNEYTPKQFTPFIYPEWGELFEECTDEKKAEYLMAIVKYPNVQIENDPVWRFIKSQLDKDYECFTNKCLKKGEASRNYWANKRNQMISNDNQMISDDNNRQPKLLTVNHLPLTETTNCLPLTKTNNFKPPTKKDIEDYCRQLGYSINIDEFYTYYDAGDWLDDSGFPIKNWKRKVISWHKREKYQPQPQVINDGLF